MKALLLVCALVGVLLGVGASCGPQQSFCPNNPPYYNCYDSEAGAGGMGGGGGTSRARTAGRS